MVGLLYSTTYALLLPMEDTCSQLKHPSVLFMAPKKGNPSYHNIQFAKQFPWWTVISRHLEMFSLVSRRVIISVLNEK